MAKKILFIGAVVLVIVLFVVFFQISKTSNNSPIKENTNRELSSEEVKVSESNSEITTPSSSVTSTFVTSEELSKHKTESDCWISYDNKVYDITQFLPKHKGSAKAISPYCGTSTGFQDAFESKHGKTKVSLLMKVGTFMGDFKVVGNL